jgi:hypothetical protein
MCSNDCLVDNACRIAQFNQVFTSFKHLRDGSPPAHVVAREARTLDALEHVDNIN